ncbi:MAG TPA: hypothetical protein DF613_14025 [Lachnospiraceae bacterium]|nr:hypothetical protein [Lachnospiraceae bacterium]
MEFYTEILSQEEKLTEAPEYIRLLPLGRISSEKGDFLVDRGSFQAMKGHMERRGIDIVIDYEHQTLKDIQAPAGGWIKELVLKNDGIYAKVEWTARAREYLRNKEYRYLSPVVLVGKNDHRALRLHSVALTNTPAINGMVPIVNSISGIAGADDGRDGTYREVCRLLNLSESDFFLYGI